VSSTAWVQGRTVLPGCPSGRLARPRLARPRWIDTVRHCGYRASNDRINDPRVGPPGADAIR